MKHLFRLITVISSIMLTSLFISGFMIYRFQTALIIGMIITIIGWIIEAALQGEISPFARGVLAAVVTAGVLLLFSITSLVSINWIGIVIASMLTGTVDLFLPNQARFA